MELARENRRENTKDLSATINKMVYCFEEQRRHIGKAHQFRNKVCNLSKLGISKIGEGKIIDAEIAFTECQRTFDELKKLNLPEDMAWEFINSAAQEMVELMMVIQFFPALIGEKTLDEVETTDAQKLGVSETAWLAGIADAAGELNKAAVDLEFHQLAEADEIYLNCVAIIQKLESLLDKFALTYPLVVSNTRRRGQGFSSKLRYVRMAELRAKENVIKLRRMKHD